MEFIFTSLILVISLLIIFHLKRRRLFAVAGNFPKGPRGLPLIGNIHQVGMKAHISMQKWSEKYGPIFGIRFGSQKFVVISDAKLVREYYSTAAVSGRPGNEVFRVLSKGYHGIVSSEGEAWETLRRFTLRHLRDFGFGKTYMEDLIQNEVSEVLEFLRKNGNKPISSIKDKFTLAVLNSLWTICSGERFSHDDPKLTNILGNLVDALNRLAQNGIFLAPWLRHFSPGFIGWNNFTQAVDTIYEFLTDTIEQHEQTLQDGHVRDLFDHFLTEIKKTTDPSSQFYKKTGYTNTSVITAEMFIGGSTTTSATLAWGILYLGAYPKVQKNMQAEIHKVVGESRTPSLNYRLQMPYTEAVIKEIFRKSTHFPLGVLHKTLSDTDWRGWNIPRGTWLIANFYTIHNSEEIWGDPGEFRPERFLGSDKTKARLSESLIPFGAGKRQCIGEQLARDTIFLFLTSIYQQFDIEIVNEKGKLVEKPDLEPDSGFLAVPRPFCIRVKLRK